MCHALVSELSFLCRSMKSQEEMPAVWWAHLAEGVGISILVLQLVRGI